MVIIGPHGNNQPMRRLLQSRHSLPAWAQALLRPAVFLFGAFRHHELSLLEGTERSGGKPLRVAFAGPADLQDAVIKRAFGAGATARALGPVPVWLSSSAIAARAPEADLVIRFVPAHYEALPRKGVLARLPAWVRMQIDLRDEACLARGKEKLARMRNRARRAGFTYAFAGRETDFVDFYDHLHCPFVKDRHGEGASIQSREETLAKLRSGAWRLLTVKSGDTTVAAGTVEFDGVHARFWQLGVRDGDRSLLEAGAADAVYAFVLDEAVARGCATLHLGHSRPFVRDGVLEYKRMLGAYVANARDERRGSVDLSVRRLTPGADDFLTENPLIAHDPDGRYRLYGFTHGGREAARERAAWWRARYCFKETLGLSLFSLAGPPVPALICLNTNTRSS